MSAREWFIEARREYRAADAAVKIIKAKLAAAHLEKKRAQLERQKAYMAFLEEQVAAKECGEKLTYPTLEETGDK